MKKGYYIHFEGRSSVGVSKKIDMQMEEFSKYFEMKEIEIRATKRNMLQRIIGLFPSASIKRSYEEALRELDDPCFIYARRSVADHDYLYFWKQVKEYFPNCKVVIEIFTYPYDKDDFAKWNAWPFYIKERIYRPKLKKYVDRFVTYSADDMIFGIPTIKTTNGINVNAMRLVDGEYKEKLVTLIGVAYMQRQHAYERIIEGLSRYYQKKREYRVRLMLVGDGPEKKKYEKLTRKYGLEEYVDFYPVTSGEELDKLYDQADIALAAFGMYKVGYSEAVGALKTRECLAKGVPIISGSPIDVLEKDFPYALICSNDASAVDMEKVVSFFDSIRKRHMTKKDAAQTIRKLTEQRISNEHFMKPIIEYVMDERKREDA